MKRLPLTLGTVITLAGCDAASDAGPSQVDVPDEPLSVETGSLLSVGVVTGDTLQEFDRVVTPFVLPDGRLVVPLRGSSEIRVFTRDGANCVGGWEAVAMAPASSGTFPRRGRGEIRSRRSTAGCGESPASCRAARWRSSRSRAANFPTWVPPSDPWKGAGR